MKNHFLEAATPADEKAEAEKIMAGIKDKHAAFDDERALTELSETQRTRALAKLAGQSVSEIASAHNISPQAVAKTIVKPAIRLALREMLNTMVVAETDRNGVETHRSFQQIAIETLVRAMEANKVFTFGCDFVERPDWPTRISAANRLLSLFELPAPIAPEKPPVAEEIAMLEQTTTTTRRRGRTVLS